MCVKMAVFQHFKPKHIVLIYFVSGWSILLVSGGCQRTNPGWRIPNDDRSNVGEEKYPTAPTVLFMPGIIV